MNKPQLSCTVFAKNSIPQVDLFVRLVARFGNLLCMCFVAFRIFNYWYLRCVTLLVFMTFFYSHII